jgi:hypothetical protein
VSNVKTNVMTELIDQAQAHKRKVSIISVTKDFIITVGLDQKVKQWSAKDLRLVWSLTLDWIPTALTVDNDTLLLGGPSLVYSSNLEFFDSFSSTIFTTGTSSWGSLKQQESSSNMSISVTIIASIVSAVFAVLVFVVVINILVKTKTSIDKEPSSQTNSITATSTLVTQILKIALPGYKEFPSSAFRTTTKLAQGGGGSVYLGEALSPKCGTFGPVIIVKQVAGKFSFHSTFLRIDLFAKMTHLSMLSFQQEISLMEFFSDSSYVAKLIGFCKEPVCLIMKYYPLGSLDSWYDKHREVLGQSNKVKMAVCGDIGRGILTLHERHVSHCDLKPQNVLVDKDELRPRFVLTDFGISKILTEEYLASEAFQIRNLRGLTVSYAAPDAINRFRKKQAGTPVQEKLGDIYSLGCVIYFVLTQKVLWE